MKFYYLVHFQFLGFRYHGWQKQADFLTVQEVIESNLKIYFQHSDFKTIGASRTDSMVSAQSSLFEMIVNSKIDDLNIGALKLNQLLPPDIKIIKIEEVDSSFRMISSPKYKEYCYFFSFGEKNHPFAAPFITHINEDLDIVKMQEAVKFFKGMHYFENYCYKPRENQLFEKEILLAEIEVNSILIANFFPDNSYVFRVQAKSFMRYQVRIMMGALFKIGMNTMTLEDFKKSLEVDYSYKIMIAPASGLILSQVVLS